MCVEYDGNIAGCNVTHHEISKVLNLAWQIYHRRAARVVTMSTATGVAMVFIASAPEPGVQAAYLDAAHPG